MSSSPSGSGSGAMSSQKVKHQIFARVRIAISIRRNFDFSKFLFGSSRPFNAIFWCEGIFTKLGPEVSFQESNLINEVHIHDSMSQDLKVKSESQHEQRETL